jgi:hypothetical protein
MHFVVLTSVHCDFFASKPPTIRFLIAASGILKPIYSPIISNRYPQLFSTHTQPFIRILPLPVNESMGSTAAGAARC